MIPGRAARRPARREPGAGRSLRWRLAAWVAALAFCAPAAAEPLDEELYAEILTRHTRSVPDLAGTRVEYRALAGSEPWRRLLRNLERTRPDSLTESPERLAYWINVYNILAIELVVRGYPVESIRDLGSFWSPVWKREVLRIDGRPISLDQVEHGILRPLGDPRIHAAIVCASLSCPSLRREPFRAARIDEQLDDATRGFLGDPRKGLAVDRTAGRVRLSRIFDWFQEDFAPGGGVLAFAARHAPEPARSTLADPDFRPAIAYFDYDWSLNDLATAPAGR